MNIYSFSTVTLAVTLYHYANKKMKFVIIDSMDESGIKKKKFLIFEKLHCVVITLSDDFVSWCVFYIWLLVLDEFLNTLARMQWLRLGVIVFVKKIINGND